MTPNPPSFRRLERVRPVTLGDGRADRDRHGRGHVPGRVTPTRVMGHTGARLPRDTGTVTGQAPRRPRDVEVYLDPVEALGAEAVVGPDATAAIRQARGG